MPLATKAGGQCGICREARALWLPGDVSRRPKRQRVKSEDSSMASQRNTGPSRSPMRSDQVADGFCPDCGKPRTGERFCANCGKDFWRRASGVTGLSGRATSAPPAPPPVTAPTTSPPSDNAKTLSTLSGIGYLVGAAAVGYLAYLQLDAGNLINQLGLESSGYRSSDFYGYAVLNGISAAITVYFAIRLLVTPTRGRLMGAAVWGAINLVWGIIQLSNTPGANAAFLIATVAFGLAGAVAFAAWSQTPVQTKT
jgi:hypothetical protein